MALTNVLLVLLAAPLLSVQEPPSAGPATTMPTALLEGTVMDAAGQPLSGRSISITSATGTRTVRTDPKGTYTFGALAPGIWSVNSGSSDGFIPQISTVSLAPNQRVRKDLRLHKAPVVSGRVLDRDKNPVSRAQVSVRKEGYINGRRSVTAYRGTMTNDLGEFRIVVSGTGAFSIEAEPKRGQILQAADEDMEEKPVMADVRTYYPGTLTRDGAQLLTLRPDHTVEGLAITLLRKETSCVTARFAATGGDAPRQVSVMVQESYPNSQSRIAEGRADVGSRLRVCGLPAGDYLIDGLSTAPTTLTASAPFHMAGKPKELAALYLRPATVLSGRMVVKDAKPDEISLNRVVVYIQPAGSDIVPGGPRVAHLKDDGRFQVTDVLPREHFLNVFGLPLGFYIETASLNGQEAYRTPFFPDPGELTITVGRDGPTISGTVVDSEGHPVADAVIVLAAAPLPQDFAPNQLITANAGTDAGFQLAGMPPGPYRVWAFAGIEASDASNPDFLQAEVSRAEELTLAPGQRQSLRLRAITIE